MKRFITNDDLTLWAKRAAALRKLTKAAQKIHADLASRGRIHEGGRAIDGALPSPIAQWQP
jgi:hypothetical protein